jgi:hypothetical protein
MRFASLCLAVVLAAACGGNITGNDGDAGTIIPDGALYAEDDAIVGLPDAEPRPYDASIPVNCVPGTTQCSNCVDDDMDGRADGLDPECISAADDRENSFATGIPGDNKDPKNQDCFFDGNSGAGNDGCDIETCCLLGNCPAGTDCSVTQQCIDNCQGAAPPGCDCFGCCTICVPSGCYTVITNPAVAPQCDESVISDPTKCPTCTPNTQCTGGPCGGTTCVLCPGQDPSSLDPSCGGDRECPAGELECTQSSDCMDDFYRCINGCCVVDL